MPKIKREYLDVRYYIMLRVNCRNILETFVAKNMFQSNYNEIKENDVKLLTIMMMMMTVTRHLSAVSMNNCAYI